MIPVICHGCGQRGKVASIPSDLACAACRSTDIDLDDRTASSLGDAVVDTMRENKGRKSDECPKCGAKTDPVQTEDGKGGKRLDAKCEACGWTGTKRSASVVDDPSLPMALLPTGLPEQNQDMDLLREQERPRKVVVPKGSAPYTQRALSSLDGQHATVTYQDAVGIHTVAGLLRVGSRGVRIGSTVAGLEEIIEVTANTDTSWTHGGAEQIYSCYRDANCNFTGTAEEMQAHYDKNHAESVTSSRTANQDGSADATGPTFTKGEGKTCDVEGCDNKAEGDSDKCVDHKERDQSSFTAKVEQITAAVLESNPGMTPATAKRVALKTVGSYPKVLG